MSTTQTIRTGIFAAILFVSGMSLAAQDLNQGGAVELSPGVSAQAILQLPLDGEIMGAQRIDISEDGRVSTVYVKVIPNLGGLGNPPDGRCYSGIVVEDDGLIAYTTSGAAGVFFIQIKRNGHDWVVVRVAEKPKNISGIPVVSVQVSSLTTATMTLKNGATAEVSL